MSMVLNRHLESPRHSYDILATDLDTDVLRHAKNGVYRSSQLQQIPGEYRADSFAFGSGDISDWMKVKQHLKSPITFEQFNLTTPHFPWENKFDLIFCRNVFIYFPREVITQVIRGAFQATTNEGLLCIGHTESIQNLDHPWTYIKPSILVKKVS